MKDHNHDLVQALHHAVDQGWRAKQHYLANAKGCAACEKLWQQIGADNTKHEKLLRDEIARHVKENRFD